MKLFTYNIHFGATKYFAANTKKEAMDYLVKKLTEDNPDRTSFEYSLSEIKLDNADEIDIVKKEEYDMDFKTWIQQKIEDKEADRDEKKIALNLGIYLDSDDLSDLFEEVMESMDKNIDEFLTDTDADLKECSHEKTRELLKKGLRKCLRTGWIV